MIKRWQFVRLKTHVLDTLALIDQRLAETKDLLSQSHTSIDSLNLQNQELRTNLNKAIQEKDSLIFLGIPMYKSGYNTLVWGIITALTLTLVIFIFLYKRSHSVIIDTKNDLLEVRNEFEAFRKRALEREEGIVRKYHNELNKYKSKVAK
jgi:hypothetical protein